MYRFNNSFLHSKQPTWRQKRSSKVLYIQVPLRHHIQVHVSQFHTTSHATNAPVSVPTPNLALRQTRQMLYHPATSSPSHIVGPKVIISVLPSSPFQFFISFYFPYLSAFNLTSASEPFSYLLLHVPLSYLQLMPSIAPLPKSCVRNNLPLVFCFLWLAWQALGFSLHISCRGWFGELDSGFCSHCASKLTWSYIQTCLLLIPSPFYPFLLADRIRWKPSCLTPVAPKSGVAFLCTHMTQISLKAHCSVW